MDQMMIVRRGQTERYRSLMETFGRDPINATVMWDRRDHDRRQDTQPSATERRRRDRRTPLPGTWQTLDFVVAKPAAAVPSPPPTRASTDALHPADGDVLVRRELSSRGPCTVSRVPDGAHGLYGTYETAVRQGEALAQQEQCDLWYTEGHQTFTLIRAFRSSSRTA